MFSFLHPQPTLTERETQRSLRYLDWSGMAAGAMFSLGSGGLMAAYALALGANNLQVGIIAALPFIAQVMRLPAILLVERFRVRKALGWPAFCGDAAGLDSCRPASLFVGHAWPAGSVPGDYFPRRSRSFRLPLGHHVQHLAA